MIRIKSNTLVQYIHLGTVAFYRTTAMATYGAKAGVREMNTAIRNPEKNQQPLQQSSNNSVLPL